MNPQIRQIFDERSSLGKLFFLAALTIVFCSLTPLLLLAPIPLIVMFLLYGRKLTYLVGAVTVAVLSGMTLGATGAFKLPLFVVLYYGITFLYGVLVSEIIFRNIHPGKGILLTGTLLFTLVMAGFLGIQSQSPMVVKNELEQFFTKTFQEVKLQNKKVLDAGTSESREVRVILDNPKKVSADVYQHIPMFLFVSVFVGIWVSFFVTLRNARIWRYKIQYPFTLKDFLNFKVPEPVIWLVIISLVSYLASTFQQVSVIGISTQLEIFSANILGSLSVLYFFQGFGILSEFLSFLKAGPFFRVLMISFSILFMWKGVVFFGVFDLWFNFRRFFKKQNNEGEKI